MQVKPTASDKFVLYHTEGCHLCDDAMLLLNQVNISYECYDICEDDTLASQYGMRIPVLKHINSLRELNWPFDLNSLREFTGV